MSSGNEGVGFFMTGFKINFQEKNKNKEGQWENMDPVF
jgi:hypothetical protein